MNNIKYDILTQVGKKQKNRRVGRGSASGYGRTAGRGHEGQRARGNIPNSFMLKSLLKTRKIRQKTGINSILYKTFDITANMMTEHVYNKLIVIKNPDDFQKAFFAEYVTTHIANDIANAFNISFYYQRAKVVGFGPCNFYIKLR